MQIPVLKHISLTTGDFQCLFALFLLETVTFLKAQYYGLLVLLQGQKSSAIGKLKGTAGLLREDCYELTTGREPQHE